MKIAVVGGGIFGVTTAIKFAEAGFAVDLFERQRDILQAASGINQYRLHRGHHYPRSAETVLSSLRTEAMFRKEYPEAIISDHDHYYCIAKQGSLVSGADYLKFCKKYGLEFEIVKPKFINHDMLDACVKVREHLMDSGKLRDVCWKKLRASGVNVFLSTTATPRSIDKYDFRVICAYARMNALYNQTHRRDYQFELCEKPVLKVPKIFSGKSIVVADGPFFCLDPFGRTGLYVMGHVVHAIHSVNIGANPAVPKKFALLLNCGVIKNPPHTNFHKFIAHAAEFMPQIAKAEHVGSMFTIRTVLPHMEKTDARPTLVNTIDDRTVGIFSGKISNCVEAAEKALVILHEAGQRTRKQ